MAGAYWEYVAAYGSSYTTVKNDANVSYRSALINASDKYKDYYKGNLWNNDRLLNFDLSYSKIGDAVYEVGRYGEGADAWGGDFNTFPTTFDPVIVRGGYFTDGDNAGICAMSTNTGEGSADTSFRSCIVVIP
jgi:hypothetical protein